ncbi:MAG: phosphotyrosine protein phosphatase [Micavibrio aeruginosavorus]|uniref:protein-tyrosine-phosphatase n=1 Tax=Micavibrio aeruginosavorus TaxID=349221 RepID=A0A2W4ZNH5_9BACT|nr:MAG: phosphotyrosine protein phosphatase [Micavibrio aeruginosavorus]
MPLKTQEIAVLFVCTGNICRSPTAHAVFWHKVREAGLDAHFRIESAGTHGYHIGDPSDPRAVATAWTRGGVDMSDLRARKIKPSDFGEFDYILAMDNGHHRILKDLYDRPQRAGLAMFLTGAAADVPDPYYGTQRDFDHVYDLVEAECDALLSRLRVKHGL